MKNQKQAQINPADMIEYLCPKCNGTAFDVKVRIFKVSKLAPSNPSGKDVFMSMPIYKCGSPICSHILEEVTPG